MEHARRDLAKPHTRPPDPCSRYGPRVASVHRPAGFYLGTGTGSGGRPPPRRANPARRASRPLAAIAGHRRPNPRIAWCFCVMVGICPPGTFIALLRRAMCSANGWSDSQRSTPIPSSTARDRPRPLAYNDEGEARIGGGTKHAGQMAFDDSGRWHLGDGHRDGPGTGRNSAWLREARRR